MPIPIGDIAIKDLLKYPRTVVLYAALVGIGWLAEKLVPSDCEKEVTRWQNAFYHSERRSDSLLEKKELVIKSQYKTIQTTDSLLNQLGVEARLHISKNKGHEH
jgi:hypothetical protein